MFPSFSPLKKESRNRGKKFKENQATLTPDGRWICHYFSDEGFWPLKSKKKTVQHLKERLYFLLVLYNILDEFNPLQQ